MNLWSVLKASKRIPVDDFFDLLFAQSMGGAEQWQTYEGTLPATLNANGDDMRQYQIWGNTGGVGDRTENCLELRDDSFTKTTSTTNLTVTVINGVITFDGTVFELPSLTAEWKLNLDFYLDAGTYYITEPPPLTSGFGRYIKKYDDDSNIVSAGTSAFTLSERTHVYLAFYIYDKTFDNAQIKITLVEGSTPPETYVPYGYEVDMSVSDGTTVTTPVYIGDTPLGEDEYVDYQAGKIYRMIDGTLTPTDPPVPLPALPTCDGETVVDYAGQSVAPEKVLLEYKKGGA